MKITYDRKYGVYRNRGDRLAPGEYKQYLDIVYNCTDCARNFVLRASIQPDVPPACPLCERPGRTLSRTKVRGKEKTLEEQRQSSLFPGKVTYRYSCKGCHVLFAVKQEVGEGYAPCIACGSANVKLVGDNASKPVTADAKRLHNAHDMTMEMVARDYGLTNLKDGRHEGENMVPPLPAHLEKKSGADAESVKRLNASVQGMINSRRLGNVEDVVKKQQQLGLRPAVHTIGHYTGESA